MKTILYSIALILTFSIGKAQENNALLIDHIKINSNSISQTESSFVNLFGNPDSIESYLNEIGNETWVNYKYSQNSFYFYENKLVSFDLENEDFSFHDASIKVGLDLSGIHNLFYNSYMSKEVINSVGFIIIDILMSDGTPSDSFIVINYNPVNNIITSIKMGDK